MHHPGWHAGPDALDRDHQHRYVASSASGLRALEWHPAVWMDAERIGPASETARTHPDWIVRGYDGQELRGMLDLTNPQVAQWIASDAEGIVQLGGDERAAQVSEVDPTMSDGVVDAGEAASKDRALADLHSRADDRGEQQRFDQLEQDVGTQVEGVLDDVWRFANGSFTLLGHCQQSVGAPMHLINDVLWLLGNADGTVVTYNLSNNTSSALVGGPPVMNCTSALWEGSPQEKLIFVFGGLRKSSPFESQTVYEYDVKTGTTRVREEPMPFTHYNGACAKLSPPADGHTSAQVATKPLVEALFFGGKSGSACINTTFEYSLWQGARIYLPLVVRNS